MAVCCFERIGCGNFSQSRSTFIFCFIPVKKLSFPGWSQTSILRSSFHCPVNIVFHPFSERNAFPFPSSLASLISPRNSAGGGFDPRLSNIIPIAIFDIPTCALELCCLLSRGIAPSLAPKVPSHADLSRCGSHASCGRGCAIPSRPSRGPTSSPSTLPRPHLSSSRYDPPLLQPPRNRRPAWC
jgi:hypothetical protein